MQLQIIHNKIHEIRGSKVMLDFDLAEMYETETRVLKQSVRRNMSRFPNDFMFQLTKKEWSEVITICDNLPTNIKFSPSTPFAFTEQGVAMLASVLNSEKAILVNISIIRAFVMLREFAINYKELAAEIAKMDKKYNKNFEDIYKALNLLIEKKNKETDWENRKRIGFKK